jgi:acetylornithine deacetylase
MVPENLMTETADLLKALIAIPSVSGQEGDAADFLHMSLTSFFPHDRIRRSGQNVSVDISGVGAGPTLLLCSHFDTVQVAPGWTRDPFGAAFEGERIYGLGANDAGASIVSMVSTARHIGRAFNGRLVLCLAAEEEAGNQGFVKIESELPRYEAAIFGEPTGMGVASAMRGSMRVRMRSHGKSCHASRPWEGRNATDAFVKDVQTLRALDLSDHSPWRQATIEPTVIRGGDSTNQIPGLIETILDIRTTPDKNNDWVIEQLNTTGVDFEIIVNRRSPTHSEPLSRLMQAIRKVQPALKDYIFNGSCDMAFSTAPSVIMGPGRSERSHTADEFITVPELVDAVTIYRSVLDAFFDSPASTHGHRQP